MPRYTTVNRRNLNSTLVRKTLYVSEEAMSKINKTAEHLRVSQGSLTDTALHYLTTLSEEQILDLLYHYSHLTDQERHYIEAELEKDQAADEAI